MAAPIDNEQYRNSAIEMRLQVGATLFASLVWGFKIKKLNPVTAGVSAQMLAQIMKLISQLFPKPPHDLIKSIVIGGTLFGTYKALSRVDQRLQAVFFILFVAEDVRVIGPKNVWSELKK